MYEGQDKPYEQYGASPSLDYLSKIETVKGSVKVTSCNKNLLDMEKDVFIEKYGLTVKTDKNNELTLNGKSTNATFIKLYGEEMVVHTNVAGWKTKKIKKGTYTLSISKTGETSDNNINLLVRQGKDTTESNTITQIAQIGSKTTASSKFEIKEDTEIAIWLWLNINNTLNDFKLKVQLERGDKATEIIGNQEDSVVLPIQEEMLEGDYFDKDAEGNCFEVHNFSKKIFNGTENITLTTNQNSFTWLANGIVSNTATDKVINILSNSYIKTAWKDSNYKTLPNAISSYSNLIGFNKGNFTTIEEFKNKLKELYEKGSPVIVYYPLATPNKLPCTQEQIQALEKLDKLKTYKNITNITTDSIAILDVDYKKDLETVLSQITKESEA